MSRYLATILTTCLVGVPFMVVAGPKAQRAPSKSSDLKIFLPAKPDPLGRPLRGTRSVNFNVRRPMPSDAVYGSGDYRVSSLSSHKAGGENFVVGAGRLVETGASTLVVWRNTAVDRSLPTKAADLYLRGELLAVHEGAEASVLTAINGSADGLQPRVRLIFAQVATGNLSVHAIDGQLAKARRLGGGLIEVTVEQYWAASPTRVVFNMKTGARVDGVHEIPGTVPGTTTPAAW